MERQDIEKLKIIGFRTCFAAFDLTEGTSGSNWGCYTILTSRMHKPDHRWTILGKVAEKNSQNAPSRVAAGESTST